MLKRQMWLCLSLCSLLILLNCRRKQPEIIEPPDPSCENGSCCVSGGEFTLYKRLKGEAVFYNGSKAIVFQTSPIVVGNGLPFNGTPYRGFLICPAAMKNLPEIPFDDTSILDIKEYNYRIYGRMYRYEGITDFAGNPVHYVAVDRLEVVK